MTRSSIVVIQQYCALRGLITKGFAVYGPFDTPEEALTYCSTNFPDDTVEVTRMYKEIIVYGDDG
jgi:hypothetical protein